MRFDILTGHPGLLEGVFTLSILKRAQDKGLVEIHVHNLHEYSPLKHKNTDDYPFGGGGGMVMRLEPIAACIRKLKAEREYDEVIYMTPDGQVFDQSLAHELCLKGNLIILCGHFKGVDERVRQLFITRDISIGDFVLTGGELPAALVVDAVVRLIPGVLNDEVSALTDSFQDGLLAPPVYTRPAEWEGHTVPEILTSGHQENINKWRFEQQLERTKERRPDLLEEGF